MQETQRVINQKLLDITQNLHACLPTTALFAEEMTFLDPDGSLTLDFLVSGLWEMTVA